VIDTTLFAYRPGEVGEQVVRLAGIAADGVAKVQVLGIDCRVVAETPVVDNVYVADDLPSAPAVAIEALDKNGNRVFLDRLRFWDDSACARAAG
jgi:tRNA (Thr-GGU) A37 N-methylase